MILFTDNIFLTDEQEGFRICRETRTKSSTHTMTALLCEAGYIDLYYHGGMLRVNPGELFVRIPDFNQPIGPYEMSPDFHFKQVTINAPIYEQLMYEHIRIEPNWYAKQEYLKEHPIYKLSAKSKDFFYTYFHLFMLQLQEAEVAYRVQILRNIARAAVMEMLHHMDQLTLGELSIPERVEINHSDYTFREFTRLLQQNPHEREVQWYAKQLGISPKYLSEICKVHSGKSASQWIADVTVTELKHYLRNTTMPIREVAKAMEFPNASFFCQYTKKHTGLTPNHLRKQKDN